MIKEKQHKFVNKSKNKKKKKVVLLHSLHTFKSKITFCLQKKFLISFLIKMQKKIKYYLIN